MIAGVDESYRQCRLSMRRLSARATPAAEVSVCVPRASCVAGRRLRADFTYTIGGKTSSETGIPASVQESDTHLFMDEVHKLRPLALTCCLADSLS